MNIFVLYKFAVDLTLNIFLQTTVEWQTDGTTLVMLMLQRLEFLVKDGIHNTLTNTFNHHRFFHKFEMEEMHAETPAAKNLTLGVTR